MLKMQINRTENNHPKTYILALDKAILSGDTIVFHTSGNTKNELNGEYETKIVRTDGEDIHFTEQVNAVIDSDTIAISNFAKRVLTPKAIKKIKIQRSLNDEMREAYLIEFNEPHCLIHNRDNANVKGYWIKGEEAVRSACRRCDGDEVIASLNQDKSVISEDENGFYLLFRGSSVTVKDSKYACVTPTANIKRLIENPFNGEKYTAEIPVNIEGKDYTDTLIVYTLDENIESIPYFFCYDERFVQYEDGSIYKIKDGVSAIITKDYISVSLPFGHNFSLKMDRDTEIENYAETIAQKSITEPIDYERYQFQAYYKKKDDGNLYPATEIEFNLHFRERDTNNGWAIKENGFWNNYAYDAESNSLTIKKDDEAKEYLQDTDSDLLGSIGFTDDDVNYQSMALQQSFIRLSFYDTPFRGNQNLLFYNTIFADSNKFYSKYAKAVTNKTLDSEYASYQWKSGSSLRLGATFNAFSKYNMSGCSEGFYLYLFKGTVDEDSPTTIYMKVEFNHAKYGVTVPFILPRTLNGTPISPTSKDFPINYFKSDDSGYTSIDMSSYGDDLYIPITIEYNKIDKVYIWRSPLLQKDGKIVFNLFEPRLNPTTAIEIIKEREDGKTETTELLYDEDNGQFVKTTMQVYSAGERRLCSKTFLKTVEEMSINSKIVSKTNKYNFSSASTYDIVYKLKEEATSGGTVVGGAFADITGITEMRFNNNIAEIGSSAVANNTINKLYIGKQCKTIGYCAFARSRQLTSVDLSECAQLSLIQGQAFQGSLKLQIVKFPNNAIEIRNGAFSRTGIKKLAIPDNSQIYRYAFSRCYQLEDVSELGNNLTIGGTSKGPISMFSHCAKLVGNIYNKTISGDTSYNFSTILAKFGETIPSGATYADSAKVQEYFYSYQLGALD